MGIVSQIHNPIVFLDFLLNGNKVGRVVLELYTEYAPKTCENFRALCTGEKGIGESGHALHFKGSIIHKVVTNILLQGGDITNFDGSGGDTIYGRVYSEKVVPDKDLKFEEAGILGLANSTARGEGNTSQFFITVDPCPHLEGSHISFGKVLKGLEVVRELTHVEHDNNVPVKRIEIGDCGELRKDDDWGYIENDGTADNYPPFPDDWELPKTSNAEEELAQAVKKIRESGNLFFTQKNFVKANDKYEKSLRYLDWAKKNNYSFDINEEQHSLCLLNLAATKLLLKEYSESKRLCSKVIAQNPEAVKAYFRRGKANFGLNEYEAALTDLKKALELEPNDPHIRAEIIKVKSATRDYLEDEKLRYAAMLKSC